MKNQIRMITGIGTPIIHSSIERMAFLLFGGEQTGARAMPAPAKTHSYRNQRLTLPAA